MVSSNDDNQFVVVDRFPISPQTLPSTRLHALSNLYFNYVFKKIKIKYRTRQSTMRDGQVGLFFYDDPGELPSSAPTGYLLESMILEGQKGKICSVYQNFELEYHGKPFRPSYRCTGRGGEIQDTIQTNICLCVDRPSTASLGESMGMLEIEYELEFSKPKTLVPSIDELLEPNYVFKVGSGAVDSLNSITWASWQIDNTQAPWYNMFLNNQGIYLITFNAESSSLTNAPNWKIIPQQGASMFMSAVYDAQYGTIKFSMYEDWSNVVSDNAMRNFSAAWKTFLTNVNMHRIVPFFDVKLNAEVSSKKSDFVSDKVVQPETVSNGINQRVFVDPKYIETINSPGQSRNLSSYL